MVPLKLGTGGQVPLKLDGLLGKTSSASSNSAGDSGADKKMDLGKLQALLKAKKDAAAGAGAAPGSGKKGITRQSSIGHAAKYRQIGERSADEADRA